MDAVDLIDNELEGSFISSNGILVAKHLSFLNASAYCNIFSFEEYLIYFFSVNRLDFIMSLLLNILTDTIK